METKTVLHKNDQPFKVLLQKTRDGYKWEVSVSGNNIDDIMADLQKLNSRVKSAYGGKVA